MHSRRILMAMAGGMLSLLAVGSSALAAPPQLWGVARQAPATAAQGRAFSLLIKPDGSLWASGGDSRGQLGTGDRTARTVFTPVGAAREWRAVACGDAHALALKSDGSLWAWGANDGGQLGLKDRTDRSTPTRVGEQTGWVAIAAGGSFSLAIRADGTLWAWGANASGQLGVGDRTRRLWPTRIPVRGRWRSVSAGRMHALAVRADGTLWAWGANDSGQLGLRGLRPYQRPRRVGTSGRWSLVRCGDKHTAALRSDGSLWAWGHNGDGQLGLGDRKARGTPRRVGRSNGWTAVACGRANSAALRRDGSLWAWGDGSRGQPGQGDTRDRLTPRRLALPGWTAVECGGDAVSAVTTDGGRWTWGGNEDGQLGLGDRIDRHSPELCMFLADADPPTIVGLISSSHPDASTWYRDRTPAFSWTASDASGVAGYCYSLDRDPRAVAPVGMPDKAVQHGYAGVADGVWYFHVRAVDGAGNWGPTDTAAVQIDATAPEVSVASPRQSGTIVKGGGATCAWTVSDAASGVVEQRAMLDGVTVTQDAALGDLALGAHTFTVMARDAAGNSTTTTVSFTVSAAPTAVHAGDLVTVGPYAYVAAGSAGLLVYDITDPEAPVLVGSCDTAGTASDVAVVGRQAYVADGPAGIAVLDVTDAAHPGFVRTLTMPGPTTHLATSQGRLLDGFETAAGWTATLATLDTTGTGVKEGDAALVASVPGATTAMLAKGGLGWDLSADAGAVQLWVRLRNVGIPDFSQAKLLPLKVYLSNDNSLGNAFVTRSNAAVHEGWNLLRFTPADWDTVGSPNWSAPIQRVAFSLYNSSSWDFEVTFDDLRAGVTGLKPAFLWTFDDGYEEDYADVFPYLSSLDQGGTMYVRSDWPGTGGQRITMPHLRALYDAGWTIGNHTVDHSDLSTLDYAAAKAKIEGGRDWLISQGFTRGADHLAYPFNATNVTVMAAARDAGVVTARGAAGRNAQLPTDEPYYLTSFDFDVSTPTVAQWTARIDKAIAGGETVICCAHDFDALTLPVFRGVADYLAARHVWAPSIGEWWDTLAMQSGTMPASAGRYLYAACGGAGLQVVDISEPLAPKLSGRCDTRGTALDLDVAGDSVYVADGTGGLAVVNVVRPEAPVVVGSWSGDSARGVAVREGVAYIAGDAGMTAVDVADPGRPVKLGGCAVNGTAADLAIGGDRVYVAAGASGVQLVDVGEPSAPRLVGWRSLPGDAGGLATFGGRVYVACGSAGLQITAVTTP